MTGMTAFRAVLFALPALLVFTSCGTGIETVETNTGDSGGTAADAHTPDDTGSDTTGDAGAADVASDATVEDAGATDSGMTWDAEHPDVGPEDAGMAPYCTAAWKPVAGPARGAVWAMASGGGTIVAVGDAPNPVTRSSDGGLTWAAATITVTSSEHMTGAAYGNGSFIAVAMRAATIFKSDDKGATWQAVHTTADNGGSGVKAAFGNGVFIVGRPDGEVLSSRTGSSGTWSSKKINASIKTVAFGGGRFLIGTTTGNVYTTVDGSGVTLQGTAAARADTITTCGTPRWISGGALSGGWCVSDGDGGAWTCADGLLGSTGKFYSSAHEAGQAFIGGDGIKGAGYYLFASPDCGGSWHQFKPGHAGVLISMVSTGARILLGDARGNIVYSPSPIPDYGPCIAAP